MTYLFSMHDVDMDLVAHQWLEVWDLVLVHAWMVGPSQVVVEIRIPPESDE